MLALIIIFHKTDNRKSIVQIHRLFTYVYPYGTNCFCFPWISLKTQKANKNLSAIVLRTSGTDPLLTWARITAHQIYSHIWKVINISNLDISTNIQPNQTKPNCSLQRGSWQILTIVSKKGILLLFLYTPMRKLGRLSIPGNRKL